MNWQLQLITLYDHIDTFYHSELWVYCQRMSNNSSSSFSDVEAITIYLFGIIKKQREVIDIYSYTRNHLSDWFPNLPAYSVYIRRLNYICEVFAPLIEKILETFPQTGVFKDIKLIDSMPIILASARRSNQPRLSANLPTKVIVLPKVSIIMASNFIFWRLADPENCRLLITLLLHPLAIMI